MSRVVRGLGLEPDPRGLDQNDPKVMRNYRRRLRNFKKAEKAFNLIKKLRKRRKKQKGTPEAGRIQRRINALRKRKDRLFEMSRIKNLKSDSDRGRDRGRDRDRDRDRGRDIVRDRDRDRGRKSTGGFFSGGGSDRSTREDRGTRSTGGLFGGKDKDSDFSKVKDRSGRVYYRSRGNKDD
tara:strand:- start:1062 stop:1601 length:540 start_codon:yes stop_codon:yes gene_type:complete